MKKTIALLLCLVIAMTAVACGANSSITNTESSMETIQKSSEAQATEKEEKDVPDDGKTTLMIYMIGSDLETKSAAATDDLIEIEESGVDLSNNEVIVYTGGCPQWQNDMVTGEKSMVLRLVKDGYDAETSFENASMGESETLARFLNYCAEYYPADHYALILWDHGNGPVIGYGKDILYENDSMTLSEMTAGLEKSPFKGENKLSWVGFDACLMASAELSCMLSPYAKYLVASQEIEPAFGWNYDFLKDYGKKGIKTLLSGITESYLQACLTYFESKDYHDRDTTLACVDLRKADTLKEALNALFAAASKDVEKNYDRLAACRVDTRSLGRASTGSEYDLVDLKDFAQKMQEDYPDEAGTLLDTIDRMMIRNATNGIRLCGMSLYYPFYNKSYYENQWRDTYREMNVFSEYVSYLKKYEMHWLGADSADAYATSEIPEKSDSNYVLQLTEEQAKHYASAKYYILEKVGKETFTKVYSSADVDYKDGKLTANFDGNVIYGHNNKDDYFIPVTTEHDTVGDVTNYSVNVQLSDKRAADSSAKLRNGRFVIAADKKKGEIAISALTPRTSQSQGTDLAGGKYEELDISEFVFYYFWRDHYRTVTRTNKGLVKPIDEWKVGDANMTIEMSIADGLEFVYAPLDNGHYAIVFEICDTQNNLYCSEPIDIETVNKEKPKNEEIKPTVIESDGTFPLLLKEDNSIALYLDKNEEKSFDSLTLYAENKTDKKLRYYGTRLSCNGTLCCNDGKVPTGMIAAKEKKRSEDVFDFGDAADTGALKKISSLGFTMVVLFYEEWQSIWDEESFVVNFKEEQTIINKDDWLYHPILDTGLDPLYGAVISKQTIEDTSDRKIELLTMGLYGSDIKTVFRVTNKSQDEDMCIDFDGLAIDDIFLNNSEITPFYGEMNASKKLIEPQMTAYRLVRCSTNNTKRYLTKEGAQKADVVYRTADNTVHLYMGYGDTFWKSVVIGKKSKDPLTLTSGKTTLLEENGVTVKLHEFDSKHMDWLMTLENHTKDGVMLKIDDLTINGKRYTDEGYGMPISLLKARSGPGQKAVIELSSAGSRNDNDVITFRLCAYDFTGGKILFLSDKTITLKAK